ncbi:unnamed protein product [Prorocentrum cordatum]|uniref:Uncharacterized protein n=1 Tax=Prorocentrum cordatum TaxID=2364126 RepID=A0ABN9STL9_9DINO|nr:unnamed protein product [Polarella glacialis]
MRANCMQIEVNVPCNSIDFAWRCRVGLLDVFAARFTSLLRLPFYPASPKSVIPSSGGSLRVSPIWCYPLAPHAEATRAQPTTDRCGLRCQESTWCPACLHRTV